MNIFKRKKNITKKPWGEEEVIYNHPIQGIYKDAKVKILRVKAGHSLSKQYHNSKSEMMICLKGLGIFEMNDRSRTYDVGYKVFIDIKDIHRITAVFDSEFIELSCGKDSDIVRLEDNYGRK